MSNDEMLIAVILNNNNNVFRALTTDGMRQINKLRHGIVLLFHHSKTLTFSLKPS